MKDDHRKSIFESAILPGISNYPMEKKIKVYISLSDTSVQIIC